MCLGEIKNTIPFTIPAKRIKYLGMRSTKEVKDLYKTLRKDIFFSLLAALGLHCGSWASPVVGSRGHGLKNCRLRA